MSRIFGGSDSDENKKERKSLLTRKNRRRKVKCNNLRDQSEEETAKEWEIEEDGISEHSSNERNDRCETTDDSIMLHHLRPGLIQRGDR